MRNPLLQETSSFWANRDTRGGAFRWKEKYLRVSRDFDFHELNREDLIGFRLFRTRNKS